MTSDLKPLLEAVNAVMAEVTYVPKDGENTIQKYRFASEAAFIAKLRPAMVKHGLVLMPLPTLDPPSLERYEREAGKYSFRAVVRRRYLLGHTSGVTLELGMEGEGIDTSDKAVPKACTGAMKWLLRQLFVVETGTDPDRDTTEPTGRPDKLSASEAAAQKALQEASDMPGLQKVQKLINESVKLNDYEKARLVEAAEQRRWELENG